MKRHGKYYFLHIRWVLRAERLFRYDQMFDWASDCSGFLIRPRTKQATSIHPLQNRWLYVSCWKNFCFCSADSDVDFIFIFMKNPFWFFWSVDPFFFSSHLFCSPCWQIWMSEASVLSVLSEPCAACSHWRKIKLEIHIFISRFELA